MTSYEHWPAQQKCIRICMLHYLNKKMLIIDVMHLQSMWRKHSCIFLLHKRLMYSSHWFYDYIIDGCIPIVCDAYFFVSPCYRIRGVVIFATRMVGKDMVSWFLLVLANNVHGTSFFFQLFKFLLFSVSLWIISHIT
jgi:hypothetical protein